MFSIYHLITRKQRNPIRQDVRNSSFIGVAPTHLTRGPVARSIIILYIVMAHCHGTISIIVYQSKVSSLRIKPHRAVVK